MTAASEITPDIPIPPDGGWDLASVRRLLAAPREALYAAADAERRRVMGDTVHLRGIVEFSNICANDCLYCGIRATNRTVTRYHMDDEAILAVAARMAERGLGTIVLQSGEAASKREDDRIARLVETIRRETSLAVTLSVGNRPRATYARWRDAGMDRYLLRFETSDADLFRRLHPDCSLEDRLGCLADLADLGVQVGSGFLIGAPGSDLDRLAADILLAHALDLDMIGIGPFIAHPDTPLGNERNAFADDPDMAFVTIAAMRLVEPFAHIPATTAFDALFPDVGRDLVLARGADVFMPNVTPTRYRRDYQLYPGKPCIDDDAAECLGCAAMRIRLMGREVGTGPGHSLKGRGAAAHAGSDAPLGA